MRKAFWHGYIDDYLESDDVDKLRRWLEECAERSGLHGGFRWVGDIIEGEEVVITSDVEINSATFASETPINDAPLVEALNKFWGEIR